MSEIACQRQGAVIGPQLLPLANGHELSVSPQAPPLSLTIMDPTHRKEGSAEARKGYLMKLTENSAKIETMQGFLPGYYICIFGQRRHSNMGSPVAFQHAFVYHT